ncbi:MAG TPA: DUF2061 domain-containing protein [Candidatus Diapherotrites archaeon]|uniref:DUF2061 domain-containing protein n=1 Tax=Candidatus Iainarchaeum sp. TaxID=3101447 RepID=A0A7J4IZP9_9ARCH|nr:DUF2061 domain-containing protein [Candidatus Diapherotrites archaeon]
MDSRKKSVAKTISWRIIATLLTVPAVFALTRDVNISLGAGALDFALKSATFYVHERAWSKVDMDK